VTWLAFVEYGDFYDVPHCIVVERQGVLYAFDCPFDEDLDDYGSHYGIFRLPDAARELAAQRFSPWEAVLRLGEKVGSIRVSRVRFDPTRRRALHDDAFSPRR
jgi:hypothetical protein